MGASQNRGIGPTGALAIALLFGVAWYAAECAAMAVSDPDFERIELARRALRFLVWHLAAFAGLGLGVGALALFRPLSRAAGCWLVLVGAATLFLGVRVVEGAMHSASPAIAVVRLAGVAAGAAALAAALAGLGVLLPRRLRPGWPAAACAATSLLLIALLRSAGPGIGLGELGLADAARQLGARDAGLAAAAGVFLLGAGALRGRAATSLALAALTGGLAAPPARAASNERPDVHVFLLDTLRADHLEEARPLPSRRSEPSSSASAPPGRRARAPAGACPAS